MERMVELEKQALEAQRAFVQKRWDMTHGTEETGWRCLYCHKPLKEDETCKTPACIEANRRSRVRMSDGLVEGTADEHLFLAGRDARDIVRGKKV
jgi:ribosomal protein L16/L10AE